MLTEHICLPEVWGAKGDGISFDQRWLPVERGLLFIQLGGLI